MPTTRNAKPSSPDPDDEIQNADIELDDAITAPSVTQGDTLAQRLQLEQIERLNRDLKASAGLLTRQEVRYIVDRYYQLQGDRIRAKNQHRALAENSEPAQLIDWVFDQNSAFEAQLKLALKHYADTEPSGMGVWSQKIVGIGPVISAGLLAHLDIATIKTAGQIWAFAGYDPTRVWGKGEKRPWNADLKKLCYLIGESFVKVQNREGDIYGQWYAKRKTYEQGKNTRFEYRDQAEKSLATTKFGDDTAAKSWYEKGMLPPARIHARARRWAVKLFLAHWFEEAYKRHHGTEAPLPYPITQLGHAHHIQRPNAEGGLADSPIINTAPEKTVETWF